jgi:hypothetical protein
MATFYGFRSVAVLEDVTEGNFGRNVPLVIEVQNKGDSDTKIYINDNPSEGYTAQGIPIAAGTTRQIPMQTYTFRTESPVTVVAYRP